MGRRKRRERQPGVIGYIRVSTEEQADSGLGLENQREKIAAECQRRGLPLLVVKEDDVSGKNVTDRPALLEALASLAGGYGDVLMVAKLDRLARSVHDFTGLIKRAEREGWCPIALDVHVDTTTPQGVAMAQMLAVFAELERKIIAQRTSDALQVLKRQGVALGRPPRDRVPDAVARRIVLMRSDGESFGAIARELTAQGVPTAQGGKRWYPATVRLVCQRNDGK